MSFGVVFWASGARDHGARGFGVQSVGTGFTGLERF